MIDRLYNRVVKGESIDREDAIALAGYAGNKLLYQRAGEIRDIFGGSFFDTCSIVNARSGRCSESCKWCAQSALFKTNVKEYELIDEKRCIELARLNASCGVKRFSFVTSGRALSDRNIDKICEYAIKIKEEVKMELCASMGLLNREQLARLYKAGITRYHCNLESSPNFFPKLCSSHTIEDKIYTLRNAQQVGMSICSGGIIGMGETMIDRVDLALALRELGIKSIPLNILNPIPGTPLEGQAALSDDEILTTVAIFRFINPDAFIRFAGGRILFYHIEKEMIAAGVNAAIVGDMLTTPGLKVMEDMKTFKSLGFTLE